MVTEIYVQARMGSTRLPGKVLKPVLDKPLLSYLIERLKRCKEADTIVLLTTVLPEDDALMNFCEKEQIHCFRGDVEDVLARYYAAAAERSPETIVRICGDCPLIDPEIVDLAIKRFKECQPTIDYLSNTLRRSFPRGLDVEVFSLKTLQQAHSEAITIAQREHVTPYIYQHPEKFHLKNISAVQNQSEQRWTVDTQEDFFLVEKILEALYPSNPHFTTEQVLELLQKHPEWKAINSEVKQKELTG